VNLDAEEQNRRTNIVLILADDMGYSDIGCFGSEIATPNIDRMGREGMVFTQAYNCARCCPSRASLLTGLYPHQAGIGHMTVDLGEPAYQGYLNDSCVTITEALASSGYQTLMAGKWHVGGKFNVQDPGSWQSDGSLHPTPKSRGFEHFFGTLDGCGSYYRPHTLMREDAFIDVDADEEFYYTDAISTEAVGMIRRFARDKGDKRQKPFFLYVSYTAPHWPLHALPEDIAKYEGRYKYGWDRLRQDRYDRMVELGIIDRKWKISPRNEGASPWKGVPRKDWEGHRMAVYAAQVDRMDQGIGRILEALQESGVEENTLVLFLSDNGGCAELLKEDGPVQNLVYPTRKGEVIRAGNFSGLMPGPEETYMSYDLPWANASNTPFRLFKHWVHEGGISTPLIVRWLAGGKGRRIVHQPIHVVDIMSTILEVAGVPYPSEHNGRTIQSMEGESFLPALRGEPWTRQAPIFWEHEGNCALRWGDWKLVKKYPGPWELYNMERDRTESNDHITGEQSRAKEMIAEWDGWAERCGVLPWDRLIDIAPW
jgi:arylsulfatase